MRVAVKELDAALLARSTGAKALVEEAASHMVRSCRHGVYDPEMAAMCSVHYVLDVSQLCVLLCPPPPSPSH
jgi:hypothetical protein